MIALSYSLPKHATMQPVRNAVSVQRITRLHGAQVAWLHGSRGAHSFGCSGVFAVQKEGDDEAIPVLQTTGSRRKNSRRLVCDFRGRRLQLRRRWSQATPTPAAGAIEWCTTPKKAFGRSIEVLAKSCPKSEGALYIDDEAASLLLEQRNTSNQIAS